MNAAVDVFHGVRVVEVAEWVFVPVAGGMLADWGADVIKIEHPVRGDGYRGLVSTGLNTGGAVNQNWELANRGKRSLGLDLKTEQGRALLLELVATADVFLTSQLPSVLDRLGLGVEEVRAVNPNIIYARGHGFGVRGPDADKAAYDSTAYWARGAVEETINQGIADAPIGPRGAFGDRQGAVQLAFGIAAALFRLATTGEPSVVDVSLLASAMWAVGSDTLSALQGNYRHAAPPAMKGIANPLVENYETADGRWLQLCFLQSDKFWPDLARAVGRADLLDDERFGSHASRAEHAAALSEALVATFRSRTLKEWRDAFAPERFPWAPFQRVDEFIDDPQVVANGYVGVLDYDAAGTYRFPTGAVQFDEQPPNLRRAPEHAQDTELVLVEELGHSWDEIVKLKDEGVIP
jgi:crotonobetainyl-CoA:carnitine CoA-transferase CaiB-like acyl-CoA transferase